MGQNRFFSRLDRDGLTNRRDTAKTKRICSLVNRVYSRARPDAGASVSAASVTTTRGDLKINQDSPHGVSMVSLLPGSIDFSALKVNL